MSRCAVSGARRSGAGDSGAEVAGPPSQYARLSPSQHRVAAELVITAETNVADPTPPGDSARLATALSAARTAAEDASVRSVPSCAAVRSTSRGRLGGGERGLRRADGRGHAVADHRDQDRAIRRRHHRELHRVLVLAVAQAPVGHTGYQAEINLLVIMRHHGTTPGSTQIRLD